MQLLKYSHVVVGITLLGMITTCYFYFNLVKNDIRATQNLLRFSLIVDSVMLIFIIFLFITGTHLGVVNHLSFALAWVKMAYRLLGLVTLCWFILMVIKAMNYYFFRKGDATFYGKRIFHTTHILIIILMLIMIHDAVIGSQSGQSAWFYWIKITHIVGSMLLFGVGLGSAIYYVYCNSTSDWCERIAVNQRVGYVDGVFTAMALGLQPITGFALIYLNHGIYALTMQWWVVVMLGYGLVVACWLPAIYCRNQCLQLAMFSQTQNKHLSVDYYRYYYFRCGLSACVFFLLLIVFYWMANVPKV